MQYALSPCTTIIVHNGTGMENKNLYKLGTTESWPDGVIRWSEIIVAVALRQIRFNIQGKSTDWNVFPGVTLPTKHHQRAVRDWVWSRWKMITDNYMGFNRYHRVTVSNVCRSKTVNHSFRDTLYLELKEPSHYTSSDARLCITLVGEVCVW